LRLSPLSRPLVAAAGLAVAAAGFVVAPADAAAPAGITRTDVLAAAAKARTIDPTEMGQLISPKEVRKLVNRACSLDADTELLFAVYPLAVNANQHADGVFVEAMIYDVDGMSHPAEGSSEEDYARLCAFGALAATDAGFSLQGTTTFGVQTPKTYQLSGDVFVTPVFNKKYADLFPSDPDADVPEMTPVFSATGKSAKTTVTTTITKTATPKTAKQKKAAKKAYTKALAAASHAYDKAKAKATTSKAKAAAKRKYNARKAAAKSAYQAAIAPFRITKTKKSNTVSYPFSVAMELPENPTP
jgi:hypothetical protein